MFAATFASALFLSTLTMPAFTNHAGHVVHGIPLSVTNGVVSLARDGTNVWTVPISAFPASEQMRLRIAAGEGQSRTPTTKELRRADFSRTMRLRREALERASKNARQ